MQKSRWCKYHFIGEYDEVSGMLSVTSFITNKNLYINDTPTNTPQSVDLSK